jgi:hypothetical protein
MGFALEWDIRTATFSADLVVDANNHEPLVRLCVDKVLALDHDRVDGLGDGGEEGKQWDCRPEK